MLATDVTKTHRGAVSTLTPRRGKEQRRKRCGLAEKRFTPKALNEKGSAIAGVDLRIASLPLGWYRLPLQPALHRLESLAPSHLNRFG